MKNKYTTLKYACYTTNITMSVISSLSPVLFATFHDKYNISYSLLGLLIAICFSTQLFIDLIFSFFSHKFNIAKTVKLTPVFACIGLLIYGLSPYIFPNAVYIGLCIGTVIFSLSGGLAEVLISPVIAAIPSENPDHEMSKLHSIFAWGVVGIIIFNTLFLKVVGYSNWQYLCFVLMFIPLVSSYLFLKSDIPQMETPEKVSGVLSLLKNRQVWICFFAIFLGGAAECTMSQWSSSYLETAIGIPKVWGDIFGVALFSVFLGLGRSLYAKFGKNIGFILFLCGIGSTVCYFTAAVSRIAIIGLLACAITGFCTSMLWPGSLIAASERITAGGVFIYAMMAAGGDLGASVAPQLVGIITDTVASGDSFLQLSQNLNISPEQLGMKLGILIGMLFPLLAIPLYRYIWKTSKK